MKTSTEVRSPRLAERIIPVMGQKVDDLAELRSLVRRAEVAERQLTAEISSYLEMTGLVALHGARAAARLETWKVMTVDAARFFDLVGVSALKAMSVSISAAKRLVGGATLDAIGERKAQRVLRVEELARRDVGGSDGGPSEEK